MVVTFVISSNPVNTFKILDSKRLGKQRVEANTIIKVLEGNSGVPEGHTSISGYKNHPMTKMWSGYINGLKFYLNCCIDEWISRGFQNSMKKYEITSEIVMPWWFSNPQIHESMKASLLRKNEKYYTPRIRLESNEYLAYGYIWTSKLTEKQIDDMKNGTILPLDEICSELGTGVPSQYRISKELCIVWLRDKNINPKTNRKIKENSRLYCDYESASKFYELIE